MNLTTLDLITFFSFCLFVIGMGLWMGLRGNNKGETSKDYFLAGSSIPWWAVGGSLIASNISAEQFIGMSGSGFASGIAVASYELMAAATLLLVAKFFMPVFIQKGIYSMPQFLEVRFNSYVRSGLAVFWVILFVFINISSVLYLGAKALEALGLPLIYGIVGLAVYSAATSIVGGLRVVVWTEVAQVVILILGGVVTAWLALDAVSGGQGLFGGLHYLYEKAPEKFDLILDKSNPKYSDLPGISVLVGGMWIANLYYWGMNQYIIQRALAAQSIKEAQRGVAFAAFLKVLMPLIVVIPGIIAFVAKAPIAKADEAYPWIMSNYTFAGFKGLAFAALAAAVGSSVSAMVNSASTIFTLDIYKPFFVKNDSETHSGNVVKNDSEAHLVTVGKMASVVALTIGVLLAPALANLGEAFQFIQKYTGYISPGVVVIFLFGLFWKKASALGAMSVVVLSIPLSLLLDMLFPEIPFMNRMGLSFLILSAVLIAVSFAVNKNQNDPKSIVFEKDTFKTDTLFNLSAVVVVVMLTGIYYYFW